MKRIMAALLTTLLTVSAVLPTAVSANSAQMYWIGVSGTGTIITDEDCPILVEHEVLTFDIREFPESYYSEPESYLAYTGSVTAEYTFHNPADYAVTATLLFPFGNIPDYGMLHNWETEEPLYRTDTEKYGVSVNGKKIEAALRHSFAYPYEAFELEKDTARLSDGYAADPFYQPDMPVLKNTYVPSGVDLEAYPAASAAIELPFGGNRSKYVMVENNGFDLLEDGFRLSSFLGKQVEDRALTVYVIGDQSDYLPEWTIYENGACEKIVEGTMMLTELERLTFQDMAMSAYPEGSEVSETDWYNAVVTSMNLNEYAEGFVGSDFSYGDAMFDVSRCLMRWYAYEITIQPGQTITNTVTAPVYPDIDGRYAPSVYAYEYLLSPAKTWSGFGSLDIVINTPFYMTESGMDGFEKTAEGYKLSLPGLPEGELTFSLSSVEKPEYTIEQGFDGGFGMIAYILLFFFIPLGVVLLFAFSLGKYSSAKRECRENPGSMTPEELKRKKVVMLLFGVVAAVLVLAALGAVGLFFMAISFM